MKNPFKTLRLRQLSRSLEPFEKARHISRPKRGWLKAVRETVGISLDEAGKRMQMSKQHVQYFERAEAKSTITLRNLQRVADALGCELVYGIVPKSGSLQELATRQKEMAKKRKEQKIRDQVKKSVTAVEHTMSLEDQSPGNVDQLIEEETERRLKK